MGWHALAVIDIRDGMVSVMGTYAENGHIGERQAQDSDVQSGVIERSDHAPKNDK